MIASIEYEIERAADAVRKARIIGYCEGMAKAISRMRMIAAIVPDTVTKTQILARIRADADEMHRMVQEMVQDIGGGE